MIFEWLSGGPRQRQCKQFLHNISPGPCPGTRHSQCDNSDNSQKKESEKDGYFLPGYWRAFEWQQVHSGWKNLQESVSFGVISAIISRQLTNFSVVAIVVLKYDYTKRKSELGKKAVERNWIRRHEEETLRA